MWLCAAGVAAAERRVQLRVHVSVTGPCSPLAAARVWASGAGAVFRAVVSVGCLGEWAGIAACLLSPRHPAAVKLCAPGAWPITRLSQGAVALSQPERARAAGAERQPVCLSSPSDSSEPLPAAMSPPISHGVGLFGCDVFVFHSCAPSRAVGHRVSVSRESTCPSLLSLLPQLPCRM